MNYLRCLQWNIRANFLTFFKSFLYIKWIYLLYIFTNVQRMGVTEPCNNQSFIRKLNCCEVRDDDTPSTVSQTPPYLFLREVRSSCWQPQPHIATACRFGAHETRAVVSEQSCATFRPDTRPQPVKFRTCRCHHAE